MRIQLIEQPSRQGEISAKLVFQNRKNSTFEVTFPHPHTVEAESGLEWYFEQYIEEPYTAVSRVEHIVNQHIVQYGEQLFQHVFASAEALDLFHAAINELGYSRVTIEIKGRLNAPKFQTVLWETMRDPALRSKPLAAWGVGLVRSSEVTSPVRGRVGDFPNLNLLIVTARPSEENDVNYRTVQRPLIEQLQETSALRVNAVVLRPGTFQALKNHLDECGEAFYHIVHFDLHGAVLAHEDLLKSRDAGTTAFSGTYSFGNAPQSYQVRWGSYANLEKPFLGKKAFLFFESNEKGVAEPWLAEEIADLLSSKQIPICVLNACQSAKQSGDTSETNLAKHLHERGIPVVLAMRYSVSTRAAAIFMERLYDCIFDKMPIEKAFSLSRMRLFDQKNRDAALGFKIDLEDWALPVVYQSKSLIFNFRKPTLAEKRTALERQAQQPVFPPPRFGFVGRDLDILKIEKMLSSGRNHLLLRGMAGVGKSALLRYLVGWWVTTNFRLVKTAAYLDFSSPRTFSAVLDAIADKILDKNERKDWKKYPLPLRAKALLNELNETPYALIFDNIFELKDEETRDFLAQIKGKSFAVYGSVNPEEFLKPYTFNDTVCFLEGLDKSAAYQLAAGIIAATTPHRLPELQQEHLFDLQHLMELLAGFPSAMEQVLPFLKKMPVPDLLQAFQDGNLNLEESS